MLNDRADPPIEILGVRTNRLSRYSRNVYIDPADQNEWDPDDLSPVEKGHTYLYREDGDQVRIRCPYRFVDSETGQVLQQLRSFWALDPAVLKSSNESARRNPCDGLQDFTLSTKDFQTFTREGGALGWLVERDEVDVPALLGNIAAMQADLTTTRSRLETYRERWCVPPGPTTEEALLHLTDEADEYRSFVRALQTGRLGFAHRLNRLGQEAGRHSEYVVVEVEIERLGNALTGFEAIPLGRYEREAIHLFRVNTGAEAAGSTSHFRPLDAELRDLRPYHPALRVLSAEADVLVICLDSLTIRVTPTRIAVEGDPSVLRPYMGAVQLDAPMVSNRFRAIVTGPSDGSK